MKQYDIQVTITEIDGDGEIVEDGYDGDLGFTLETDEPPIEALLNLLRRFPQCSEFCT